MPFVRRQNSPLMAIEPPLANLNIDMNEVAMEFFFPSPSSESLKKLVPNG